MRILMATVEAVATAESGLAANFVQLCQALKREKADVTLLAPLYGSPAGGAVQLARRLRGLKVPRGDETLELPLWEGMLPGNVRLLLVEHESFPRSGIYGDGTGDWPDNAARFGLFCQAVAAAAAPDSGLVQDVVHLHDWPTGLAAYLLQSPGTAPRPPVVYSVYNLAFQGHYPASVLPELGLPAADFHPEGLEYFGHLNFLKVGLRYADAVVAMGRAHLREITSAEGGCGMDGLLRHREGAVTGIPLGIDGVRFDPARDPSLAQPYSAATIGGKRVCKRALQDEAGLAGRSDLPLVGFVPPLTRILPAPQLREVIAEVLRHELQVVLLHEPGEEADFVDLAEDGEHFGLLAAAEEGAYHRLLGGADLVVVPSLFAPGSQPALEALRYGTLPVVGGEGVLERGPQGQPLGFEVATRSVAGVLQALRAARKLFRDQKQWRLAMLEGMALELSWPAAARAYLRLYAALAGNGSSDQAAGGHT